MWILSLGARGRAASAVMAVGLLGACATFDADPGASAASPDLTGAPADLLVAAHDLATDLAPSDSASPDLAHGSTDMAPPDPCVAASDGDFCGSSALLRGGIPSALYRCRAGATSVTTWCSIGCTPRTKSGNDTCDVAADPCVGAVVAHGTYCGGSLPGGNPESLYVCQSQVTSSVTLCPGGCKTNPPGVADACNADPCAHSSSTSGGSYCGGSLTGGDPTRIYVCRGFATVGRMTCGAGCMQNPPGVADLCKGPSPYHLPWCGGVARTVTQGNNGDVCTDHSGDHVNGMAYAWDFGFPRHSPVRAARAGRVTLVQNALRPGDKCYDGCTDPFGSAAFNACCSACSGTANRVNVDHGDGTVATYLHLDVGTATVGAMVAAGDVLGYSGTSGCSSGPHLHFQVQDGCASGFCQSLPVWFAEANRPACGDQVTSTNACP